MNADLVVVPTPTPTPEIVTPLPAARNPARVYLGGLHSALSVASQMSALRVLARLVLGAESVLRRDAVLDALPWHLLRAEHTLALAAQVSRHRGADDRGYKPATIRRIYCALRGVLLASRRLRYISEEERAVASDLPQVRGRSLPARRPVTPAQVRALIETCDGRTYWGQRLLAALALLFGAGLRRSEAVTLRTETIQIDKGLARVVGKGDKERVVILGEWMPLITPWLTTRGRAPGPLLCFIGRWGELTPTEGITPARLYAMMVEHGEKVGVDFSPHDARAAVITSLLAAGVDLRRVQQFADHAKPETTARYDLAQEEVVIAAIVAAGRVTMRDPTDPLPASPIPLPSR